MASFHIQIETGGKGDAVEHARYIQRVGAFMVERGYGEVEARGVGNMPAWAREDTHASWRASDECERANGHTYREYELALPRELSPAQRVASVERFDLGSCWPASRRPYSNSSVGSSAKPPRFSIRLIQLSV